MIIAIVSPCILPVPATKGGAVEELISRIIRDNEKFDQLTIDLFTICDSEIYNFEHTNIISISKSYISGRLDRVTDKIYRTHQVSSVKRLLDDAIVKAFMKRMSELTKPYDAVIIENQMSTACKLIKRFDGKPNFPIYFHMHNDVDMYRSPEYIHYLTGAGVEFITVSSYITRSIQRADKDAVCRVLTNGIDYDLYERTERKSGDIFKFLYAGRIIPAKGVKELVLSFIKMIEDVEPDKRQDFHLDIIGFSQKEYAYEKEIRELTKDYSEYISCIERLSTSRMARKYSEYDAVVMPTMNEEPFGLVALETMAMGIPLIVSDSGALPDIVLDGAIVVKRDADFTSNLSKELLRLATSKELCKELGERAYIRAHSDPGFDISNYYKNFLRLIDSGSCRDDNYRPLISVIVPVYNVSDYLERCVDSIIRQSYTELEIILVDDGSTDNCGALCDEYKGRDSRIKVIHQENMGLGGARNSGLETATGDFIFFCDSDDFLSADTLEKMLLLLIKDDADIAACGFSHVGDDYFDNPAGEKVFTSRAYGIRNGRRSVIEMMRSNSICSVAWNKLYKRELFDGVRFPERAYHEDEATTYKLLYKAGTVTYMPESCYKYYQRSGGIMNKNMDKRYEDFVDAFRLRIDYFKERNEEELAEHSRISFLQAIKYSYRNIDDPVVKKRLKKLYKESISFSNAPKVMGTGKRLALITWKYIRY